MVRIAGWRVMAHPLMIEQLLKLVAAVRKAAARNPASIGSDPNAKLLAAISKLMFNDIPANPQSPNYRQGKTLGSKHKDWSRAKFGNGRFRLFFRYSTSHKTIIFAWVNDAETLRAYGSKTDAYQVFQGMLDSGNPPSDWKTLMAACESENSLSNLVNEIRSLGASR